MTKKKKTDLVRKTGKKNITKIKRDDPEKIFISDPGTFFTEMTLCKQSISTPEEHHAFLWGQPLTPREEGRSNHQLFNNLRNANA